MQNVHHRCKFDVKMTCKLPFLLQCILNSNRQHISQLSRKRCTTGAHFALGETVSILRTTVHFRVRPYTAFAATVQNVHSWCTFCISLCAQDTFVTSNLTGIFTFSPDSAVTVALAQDLLSSRTVPIKNLFPFWSYHNLQILFTLPKLLL